MNFLWKFGHKHLYWYLHTGCVFLTDAIGRYENPEFDVLRNWNCEKRERVGTMERILCDVHGKSQ